MPTKMYPAGPIRSVAARVQVQRQTGAADGVSQVRRRQGAQQLAPFGDAEPPERVLCPGDGAESGGAPACTDNSAMRTSPAPVP